MGKTLVYYTMYSQEKMKSKKIVQKPSLEFVNLLVRKLVHKIVLISKKIKFKKNIF